ncbi:putative carboxylesterase 12 [Prunus yedoensis var. nudiflora]|uniref:Putative carboxylesterase 12 n=1 Tax=Prunus yedoensis var. nudiflora TaxID=2094558 RepID=A0A314YH05_PRUYE|nr:putative carboxylesterase 12 [Prunus yedoensis var. nudiflora]
MSNEELAHDFSPMIKVYKDGRVERLAGTDRVPPSTQPENGVQSKDVVISQEPAISARIYIPKITTDSPQTKLPLLIYFHGGGFCIESPFSPAYHNYVNTLVSEANVVAVSVDYRLVPEHPLPAAYDDSWAAIKWVASHFDGNGSEDWLNRFADLQRVFFAGDSSGANISHNMTVKLGCERLVGVKLVGIVLVHPFFWGTEPVGGELTTPAATKEYMAGVWRFACPSTSGSDDPLINPAKDPKLGKLGCEKVLVCVAEKDGLKDRGRHYSEILKKSGWNGAVEVIEAKGEGHVFHLYNPICDNAVALQKKIVSFLN